MRSPKLLNKPLRRVLKKRDNIEAILCGRHSLRQKYERITREKGSIKDWEKELQETAFLGDFIPFC